MARTALFNWAFARHHGGTFVFRIEDTDAERDSEDSYLMLLDSLRWLGLDWDEGPEVGGDYGPYRQSERMDIYADVARRLVEAGHAYPCYCTPEELEAEREAARAAGRTQGYSGRCRHLTPDQRAAFEAEGRTSVIRFAMPEAPDGSGRDWTWDDLVRGELTFASEHVPDYVIVRANGDPLYTLVNPVDDALMRITHVLRGEDLLSSTPRQLAMYAALADIGVGDGTTPRFGHLPYVMGEGNKKLSKRDPESALLMYREEGYLPEALLNYLVRLGWSHGDQEIFSMDEMINLFDITDVNKAASSFNTDKLDWLNQEYIKVADPAHVANLLRPQLGRLGIDPTVGPDPVLVVQAQAARARTLVELAAISAFCYQDFADYDPDAAKKHLRPVAREPLTRLKAAFELMALEDWTPESLHHVVEGVAEELGEKLGKVAQPLRVAIVGRAASPGIDVTLQLVGKDAVLRRIDQALAYIDARAGAV